ncbi:MAG TPA: hypothetical protein VE987_06905 [Polyangiaceae bacterium]|nr:hypothetical protein [Polyangiaceae bacterium]
MIRRSRSLSVLACVASASLLVGACGGVPTPGAPEQSTAGDSGSAAPGSSGQPGTTGQTGVGSSSGGAGSAAPDSGGTKPVTSADGAAATDGSVMMPSDASVVVDSGTAVPDASAQDAAGQADGGRPEAGGQDGGGTFTCGNVSCASASQTCCVQGGAFGNPTPATSCTNAAMCPAGATATIKCISAADCPAADLCCAATANTFVSQCRAACAANELEACDLTGAATCPRPTQCRVPVVGAGGARLPTNVGVCQ